MMVTTATAIQQVCKSKGWAIEKLARQTGLGINYLKDLFAGVAKPSLEIVNKIATVIGVPTVSLIQDDLKVKKINFTLHLRQAGMEEKAKEKLTIMFSRLFSPGEKEEMGLEILSMDREVSYVSNNGQKYKNKENLLPGYLVVRIARMIDYERFYCCLKNDCVKSILQGEMDDQELNKIMEACGRPVIQIEEPQIPVVEKSYRRIRKVLQKSRKGTVKIAKEMKEKLEAAMEQILKQKRRYATYLRNLNLLNDYRVQKNKLAVFEFPLEIYRKAKSRLVRHLDDGWDAATVLAIRLAKEANRTALHSNP